MTNGTTVALALVVLAGACGSSDDDDLTGKVCDAGDTRECLGPGACKGAQACMPGGANPAAPAQNIVFEKLTSGMTCD